MVVRGFFAEVVAKIAVPELEERLLRADRRRAGSGSLS